MTERRFTDDEVARILRRAAELDRREVDEGGSAEVARGLSLAELQEVAAEVGIAPATIARAALELERPDATGLREAVMGGSPVAQMTNVVPRPLTPAEMARVVQVVDEVMPDQGSVTEALGSVRWLSRGRFLSRKVVLQPTDAETRIQVQERYTGRARGASHFMPLSYGLGIGLVIGADVIGGAGAGISLSVLGAVGGWGIGRAIWAGLRAASARRVRRASDAIARAVEALGASPPE
jgi:hypothetical protein